MSELTPAEKDAATWGHWCYNQMPTTLPSSTPRCPECGALDLFRARVVPPAESCLCRDPLREVHAGCPLHGHSPESVIPPDLNDFQRATVAAFASMTPAQRRAAINTPRARPLPPTADQGGTDA